MANALDFEFEANSKAGYDGVSTASVRVKIKECRVTPKNCSRKLRAVRKHEEKDFDELAAVIYSDNFDVIEALLIPHELVGEYAS